MIKHYDKPTNFNLMELQTNQEKQNLFTDQQIEMGSLEYYKCFYVNLYKQELMNEVYGLLNRSKDSVTKIMEDMKL
jgi:hypothetical protein